MRLDQPTLMYRRPRGDQIKTCKIITNEYDKDCIEDLFRMREESAKRGHNKRILKTRARLNPCKNSKLLI